MPARQSQNYEYEHIYVAHDGRYAKIGVSNSPERRSVRPIRFKSDLKTVAQPVIVAHWHRPYDARKIESSFREWFADRAVAGFEWFDIPRHMLIRSVEREIWNADEWPKDRSVRCPIKLREVWTGDLPPASISRGMRAFKERGGKVGRVRVLDEKKTAQALKLLNAGNGRTEAARAVGVSVTTIHNYFEYQPRKKVWRERQT